MARRAGQRIDAIGPEGAGEPGAVEGARVMEQQQTGQPGVLAGAEVRQRLTPDSCPERAEEMRG
jgi:hypothetical protein